MLNMAILNQVGGGRTVITTITTIAEMKPLEEHEGLEISKYLDDNDITLLQSSWENLKHCPDFAPKVFIRYENELSCSTSSLIRTWRALVNYFAHGQLE